MYNVYVLPFSFLFFYSFDLWLEYAYRKKDEKKNEALVVVVERSIDQKISNTGHKFNRIFSIDSILVNPIHLKKEKGNEQKNVKRYYSNYYND